MDAGETQQFNLERNRISDDLIALDDDFFGHRIDDGFHAGATTDHVAQRNIDLFALVNGLLWNAMGRAALVFEHDH